MEPNTPELWEATVYILLFLNLFSRSVYGYCYFSVVRFLKLVSQQTDLPSNRQYLLLYIFLLEILWSFKSEIG